ncbi:response regulator [Rheinheimera riviphila]|nr:response regulator [Rheinheimera riviphila]
MNIDSSSHIVFYSTDRESDQMLLRILAQSGARITLIETRYRLQVMLLEKSSKILIIAAENLQASLDLYYCVFNNVQGQDICPHAFVVLISRGEEQEAYDAFCGGLLDDYLVSRPLYEQHRPVIVCDHLIRKLGATVVHHPQSTEAALAVTTPNQQIAKALETKAQLRAKIEYSIRFIEQSLDDAIAKIQLQQEVALNFDLIRSVLGQIKSEEIRPELLRLQQKVIDILAVMIADDHRFPAEERPEHDLDDTLPELPEFPSAAASVHTAQPFNRLYNTINTDKLVESEIKNLRRVLLVEDDQISLNLTFMTLKSFGVEVDTATCGRIAFSYMKNKKYDFVFMDINLPDTNGLYVLDQIQRNSGINQQTPFIMLTGNKNKNTVKEAIDRGAKGYLLKPLYKDSVAKIFEKYGS